MSMSTENLPPVENFISSTLGRFPMQRSEKWYKEKKKESFTELSFFTNLLKTN